MSDREPELRNASRDAETINACVTVGTDIAVRAEHDYRPIEDPSAYGPGRPRTYLRCVWCHAVACGDYGDPDPCIEVWHHEPRPHRTAAGVTWPIGGDRHDR